MRRDMELQKSWSLEIDYARAPCLGTDQKTCGLWEQDWSHIYYMFDCIVMQMRRKVHCERDVHKILFRVIILQFLYIHVHYVLTN